MPTLTADELQDYRQLAGDADEPFDISDDRIQGFYNTAYAKGEDAETTQALTIVAMLQRLYGLMLRKVDKGGEIETEDRSQMTKHFKDALAYWEGVAGVGGAGALGVGTLDLNLIEDCEGEV